MEFWFCIYLLSSLTILLDDKLWLLCDCSEAAETSNVVTSNPTNQLREIDSPPPMQAKKVSFLRWDVAIW